MSMPAMIGCIAVLAYSLILIEISYRSTKKADTVSSGKKFFLGNGLGLIVGFACYLVVSLCTKPIPEEKRDIFMEPLRRTRVYSKTKLD